MKRAAQLLLPVLMALLLSACAPGVTGIVAPPTFRVVPSQTSLVRLEPSGVGLGTAVIHVELEVGNPNPFPINLAGLDTDLYLAGGNVAGSRFSHGIALPAGGTSQLGLDLEFPVEGAPQLLGQLARLVSGDPVDYRVDATVSVDLFGNVQRFPSLTIAQGEVVLPGGLQVPTVRFDPAATNISVSGLSALVEVGLVVDNPTPIGYFLRAPQLQLMLDGRNVGTASLGPVPVAAAGESRALASFRLGIADLGAALIGQLQGGGSGVQVALDGQLTLELPGVTAVRTTLDRVGGAVR